VVFSAFNSANVFVISESSLSFSRILLGLLLFILDERTRVIVRVRTLI